MLEYYVELATLFGSDQLHAYVEMKEVLEFEIALAKVMFLLLLLFNIKYA